MLCARPPDSDDALICDVCRSRWRPVPYPRCPRCGQPFSGPIECRTCVDWPTGLATVASAVWHDEPARLAGQLFNYECGWRVGD
jgi:predicted amidophosphoribosyltransferase